MKKLTIYLQAETSVEFEDVEIDKNGNVINLESYISTAKNKASIEWQVTETEVNEETKVDA